MKTEKIHEIVKAFNHSIVIGIWAYDKNNNELFSHTNEDGIGDNETAVNLHKLPFRKNTTFEERFNNKLVASYVKKG